jgi:hypothetical protein
MKKYFTLLVLLLFTVAANCQTYVSGFINANTTWTVANMPYIVTGNALVSQGYTLTIDAGVLVKFDMNTALQVDGQLIAIGTAANRITFTSNQPSPHAGDWAKLHFGDFSINAVFDVNGHYVSGCILKYCDVLYGGSLGYGEIHIESSSPYISQCNIMHCSASGVYCNGASFLLDSSVVNDCANYGMYFSQIKLNSCGLTVPNDTIENNAWGGLYLADVPGCSTVIKHNYFYANALNGAIYQVFNSTTMDSVTISDNYFVSNTSTNNNGIVSITGNHHLITRNYFTSNSTNASGTNILTVSAGQNPYVGAMGQAITDNYFINNTTMSSISNIVKVYGSKRTIAENYFGGNNVQGLYGAIVYTNGSTDTVECNLFESNTTSANGYGELFIQSEGNTVIRKNIFTGNSNSSATNAVSIGVINSSNTLYPLYFMNNTMKNNSSALGIGIKFSPNLTAASPLLFVESNNFVNNNSNSVIYFAGPNTANANYNFLKMSDNNFTDPQSQYELYNDIPYGSPDLYPDSNYWGSTSTQHIDSVIYDYFDFANLAVVYYQPILN